MVNHIVAIGGGGFSEDICDLEMERYLLHLARKALPKVCFIGTASGDSESYMFRFYAAFSELKCKTTHLSLFKRGKDDIREHLLSSDVIFVGGGNTANLMAIWKVHNVDEYLRQASRAGKVLAGVSAGGICWFTGGITDSFGPTYSVWQDGLSLVQGLFCPHFDSEGDRSAVLEDAVADSQMGAFAVGDGVGLHFVNGKFSAAIGRPGGVAIQFAPRFDSAADETMHCQQVVLPINPLIEDESL